MICEYTRTKIWIADRDEDVPEVKVYEFNWMTGTLSQNNPSLTHRVAKDSRVLWCRDSLWFINCPAAWELVAADGKWKQTHSGGDAKNGHSVAAIGSCREFDLR